MLFLLAISAYGNEDNIVKLDVYGERGVVYFDHRSHEMLVSPDPNWPFKAQRSAACSGCHHSTNSKGIVQLVACRACHLEEGNTKNPKSSRDMTEITTDEAFHRNCISCHRAAVKGPRLCSGCHKMVEAP
ncbi:MAG TPA: cytochrome c3 family protein [Acidobacteriota bacterium]